VNTEKLAKVQQEESRVSEPESEYPLENTDNEEETEEDEVEEKSILTLGELLSANESLKEKKTAQPGIVERPLGMDESYDPPPATSAEFDALKRIANRPRGNKTW